MEVPGRELTVGSQVTKCGRHSTWVSRLQSRKAALSWHRARISAGRPAERNCL